MAKLIFIDDHGGEYSVATDVGPTLPDIVDFIVKPVFIAAGFHPSVVDECIGGVYDDNGTEEAS